MRTDRMADWWIDDASGRGRASPDDPAVQRLVAEIDPHARVTDLGGTMSLNLRIDPAGLVLRVHQPFVSRRRLRMRWVPAARLPQHLVHGDMRLGNVCRSAEGETVYLDFGFLATRPRVHGLGYALAFMVRAFEARGEPGGFAWESVPELIEEYVRETRSPLTDLEREALPLFTAAVPLYFCAIAGFSPHPAKQLRTSLPFLSLSESLLSRRPELGRNG